MPRHPPNLTSALPVVAMAALAGITYWLLQATLPKPHGAGAPEGAHARLLRRQLLGLRTRHHRHDAIPADRDFDGALRRRRSQRPRETRPCACSSRCSPTVTATGERGTVNGDVSIVNLYEQRAHFACGRLRRPADAGGFGALSHPCQRRCHRNGKAG